MSRFFSNYPKINYDLLSDNSSFVLTDISRAAVIDKDRISDDSTLYTYYQIQDGDRPDIVSHKLYGTVDYYWTFFVANESLRAGYLAAWPLSYTNFTKMIDREYGKYSVVSTAPIVNAYDDLNGNATIDISLIPLDEKYLPHLRLASNEDSTQASILKYDASRHQLVIFDCYRIVKNGQIETLIATDKASFISQTSFKIVWKDAANADNTRLKKEWINSIYDQIIKYDANGFDIFNDSLSSVDDNKFKYISSKTLRLADKKYRWTDYAAAPYEYYDANGNSVSAYDAISSSIASLPPIVPTPPPTLTPTPLIPVVFLDEQTSEFNVINSGVGNYIINGANNPTLTLTAGRTYTFNIIAIGHPFWIKTTQTTGTANAYNSGVNNNGTANGTITFTVPLNAPSILYYNCQLHSSMKGVINITNVNSPTPTLTAPIITAQPASITINSGNTATLTVSATGSEPLTYQWYSSPTAGNTRTPVGNGSSFTTHTLTGSEIQTYWVRVSNSIGAVNSILSTVTATAPKPPPTYGPQY